jgi:GAF domain-containing protein
LGRLVRTIVPRSQLVAIFDRDAQISWATDTADHEELRTLAAELLASAAHGGHTYSMRCELDSAASYAFLMRDSAGAPTGVLALSVAGPFRRSDLLRPSALQARLAPLLAAGALAKPDSIERLIAVLAARIEAEAVIACVPDQDFVRRFRRAHSQLPEPGILQRLACGELMARVSVAGAPLRVDRARVAPDAPAFAFVGAPLLHEQRTIGVLAAFATAARRPFSAQDAAIVAQGAERLSALLGPGAGLDRAAGAP